MAQTHFLSLKDWSREEIELLFERSAAIKTNPEGYSTALAGKSLGVIFQKPSTMLNDRVVPAMAAAYEAATGDLAERMLQALGGRSRRRRHPRPPVRGDADREG